MEDFKKLWREFSDIPVNEDDEIEERFLGFEIGTDRFEIWHWFEENFDVVLGDVGITSNTD
jgi:hypothetical protein